MPVSTSPVKILLDLEIDLDNLSSEENYLSALIEATNMLSISNSGDGRIKILQEEIKRVRGERVPAIKERRTRISKPAIIIISIELLRPNTVCINVAPTLKNKPIFKIPPKHKIIAPTTRTFLPNLIS